MAGRTNTEKIDELIEAVAKLKGNVEALSKFVDSIEKDIDEIDARRCGNASGDSRLDSNTLRSNEAKNTAGVGRSSWQSPQH